MMEGNDKMDIRHPEACELLVAIDEGRVDYIIYATAVEGSLITDEVNVTGQSLQGLEDAVYDTPALLNEYKRVRVLVHSRHFVLLPIDTRDDDCVNLLQSAFPDDDGDAAVSPMAANGVKVAWLMPRGMLAFLRRTFNYPVLSHHLVPFCEYLSGQGGDNGPSGMFLNLRDSEMDMAIYREGRLLCANTYPLSTAADAAYYVMNAWRTHDMDQLADELQIMGTSDLAADLTAELRNFVKHVMPAVFPAAATRMGRNAMRAPLHLILMAICE